jgi:hypothetical protein
MPSASIGTQLKRINKPVDLADLAFRGVRDYGPPRSTEFSLECALRRPGAHSTFRTLEMVAGAGYGWTGSIGIVPVVHVGAKRKAQRVLPWRTAAMTGRTTQKVIRFLSEFSLPGFDAPQPPGEYLVDYDEEPIEVASHLRGGAWPLSSICRRSL